ncbi:protein kinase [Streptomyces sp. NPDC091272]|uniref:protein kinase domain-containing protein n=1 Tax=Streptomyces sp. NPDC091272 TaxID=3365981 RepID=UPI00380B9C10
MSSTDGQRLVGGRYLLVEPLGRGGMGTVWRATDQVLERVVAVKETHPQPAGEAREERWERARREALAVARIAHPHVIDIYDLVHQDDRAWLVTEFVDGPSLADHVAQNGPLDVRRVAEIGAQLLDALGAVHAVGALHRDVKPANVLLRPDGAVVLCDFGIATLAGADSLTVPGGVLGSVEYIAPERLTGGDVGPASDLFSLGCTLAALIGGRSPFARQVPVASLHAVASEPAEIPAAAGPLGGLLESLLRKDPAERPAPEEVARVLRTVAQGAGPSRGDTRLWTGPVPAPARRRRSRALRRSLVVAAALLLVGGSAVAATVLHERSAPRAGSGGAEGAAAQAKKELRVMTLNTWDAGQHVDGAAGAMARAIRSSGADVVALQESSPALTSQVAAALGWRHRTDGDAGVDLLSRRPVQAQDSFTDDDSGAEAVAVRVSGVWVYSVRLDPENYGPYNACFDEDSYQDIYADEESRAAQAAAVARWTGSAPAIVAGDLNGPSHLDWTEDTKDHHCDSVVEWPTTKAFADHGFQDSFREVHPDPAADRGDTWSTVAKRNTDHDDRPEPQDRIDFVLHKGGATKALASRTVGAGQGWPSDHRAVLTTFRLLN